MPTHPDRPRTACPSTAAPRLPARLRRRRTVVVPPDPDGPDPRWPGAARP